MRTLSRGTGVTHVAAILARISSTVAGAGMKGVVTVDPRIPRKAGAAYSSRRQRQDAGGDAAADAARLT